MGEGGSRTGALASVYYAFEDRYYGLMDWLEERGVKVYDAFVYPLEKRGIPSFPVAVLILLSIIALLAFLLYPRPATAVDFNLRVFNGTKAVDGALVEVYIPGENGEGDLLLLSGNTAGGGSIVFYGVPPRLLRFTASKDGENATDLIDASRINGRLDFAFKPPVPPRPPENGLSSPKTTKAAIARFQSANVFDKNKPIGQVTVISKGTPPPDANAPVPSTSPTPPSADKGQVTVEIRDASSGSPISSSASVSLIDAITLQKVSSSSSQSGSAAFNGIAYGSTLYAQVSATGYLPYDGLSAGEVFYINSPSRTITILLSPASGADAVSANILVRNRASGAPLSATLRLFRQDASLPEYEGVVAGTRQFVLKKNAVYSAEASASGFGPATKSFTADGTDVVVELDAVATPNPNSASCQVIAPASGTEGSPVAFRVLYTGVSAPASSAAFSCSLTSQTPVSLSCVSIGPNGGSCSATCTYAQAGSYVATANGIAKGVSCTAPAAVVISAGGAPSPQHSICSVDRCIQVDGAGPNSCASNPDCLGKHNACGTSGSCEVVAGNGEATCETSAQCTPSQAGKRHSVCSNNACVSVEGEGFDECSSDSQCAGVHSDCTSGKCVVSAGAGDAQCQTDGQCVAPPSGQSCSDGTSKGECSSINAGARCSSSLVLVDDPTCPSPASLCSDGTGLNSCSATKPLYCDANGILNSNSAKCGCPSGTSPDGQGITCKPPAARAYCDDGTPAGECTSTMPFQCTADGSDYLANAAQCGCPSGFIKSGNSCVPEERACSDGTLENSCSATKPLYCDGNRVLGSNAAKCGCTAGYSAAPDGILCTPNSPVTSCPDGTPNGVCTANKPFQCTADGSSYAANAAQCGCPQGFVKSGNSCVPIENACSDGTLHNFCSSSKPFFCDASGGLAPNAAKCGCASGSTPAPNGLDCVGPPKEKCDDGTARGQCTSNKPLACKPDGSGYVENAGLCNCPSGFVQSGDSCVEPGKACSDGTSLSSCSSTQPLYCDGAGVLHSGSAKCGCPAGYMRDSSGVECTPVGQVNSCPDGTKKGECTANKPFQCGLDASTYDENAAKCGCPSGFAQSGASCVPSSATCGDGTTSGACSGVTKGYQCTREGEGYFLELNSQCGCPVGWKLYASACYPPELRCGDGTPLGSCTTVLANMPLYCGIAQGNAVPTLYSNASASCGCPAGQKPKDGICIECADNSCGELAGGAHCTLDGFDYAAGSCVGISQPLFCTPSGNLVKKSDPCGCPGGKVPDSKGVDCVAGAHDVAPSCLLDLDPNSPNLGSVANAMGQYAGLAEPAGVANQPAALACGRIDAAAIPPLSPLACKGGSGVCATQCPYPQSVDLARNGNADQAATLAVGPPDANAQCSTGFSFVDRPAVIRVKATHATPVGEKPVPTGQVTLLRIDSGASLLCASQAADENGEAVFDHCTDSDGRNLYSLLAGDRVEAAVAYKDGSGTTLLSGKGAVALFLPASLGENSLGVSLDAPFGTVAASVVDAVTGQVTPDLKSTSFTLACQEPLLQSQGIADFFVAGKCSGSECGISAPAFVECRLFAKAPNYFDSSDILVPRIKSQADKQAAKVSLIPKSFDGASLMVLDGVYDLEKGTAIPTGGQIFKSFDYVAKATLKSFRRSDGGAGAFFQTGVERDDCSHSEACIFGATADPNYPLWAKGAYYIDEQCSRADLDFGNGPDKTLYKWADINSINDVNGVPYSGQFLYSFRTNENSPATSLPLLYRSYVVNGGKYTLSPYDADVLFANKPLCMANANSATFNFASSQKACSDDASLCVSVTFSQASNAQNGQRGDGFAALSNSKCLSGAPGSVNPDFCQPLLASFEIQDDKWTSIREPYKVSFAFPSANLKASKVVFSSFDNAEIIPAFATQGGVTSFTIDIGKEFYKKGFKPQQFIRGYIVSDPLATTVRADLSFGYSTAAAAATRKTWISVVDNPNAVSKYALGQWTGFTQDEQLGFTTDGNGNAVMNSPFTRTDSLPPLESEPASAPYASLNDCASPFAGASGGWDCTPFKIKFSFTAFQPSNPAQLSFSIDRNFLGLRSLSYSVLDNVGNKKAGGVATVWQDGASASSSIPSIEAGDSITATAELDAFKPTDASGKAKFSASFTNGPADQGGTLALESFVTIRPSYGVVKFVASDESTGNAIKPSSSPLISSTFLSSIRVADSCRQGASPNACSYRITSLPNPIDGALLASATASGYFDSAPQLFSSSAVPPGSTFATAPSVSIPLIPLAQDTIVSVSSISDAESGEVVCSTATVKCDDAGVFLSKARKYKAHLTAGFKAGSSRVGVAVAAEPFNSGTALIYDSSRKFPYAATSLPIDNYRGGTEATDTSCNSAGISTDGNAFFKGVTPEQGLGWLEISADSAGRDISGKALDADVFFFIPDGTSASSFTLGFRSFAIVKDANGIEKYLRFPFDSDLGLNRDSQTRFSCQAKAQSLLLKLNSQGDTCSQEACLRVAKYSQVRPSGSEDENAGQSGFEAVSRDDWAKWSGADLPGFIQRDPQPLEVHFAINLLKTLPAKSKLSFRIDDKHLEFDQLGGAQFDLYCGNAVDSNSPKKKILPSSKTSPFEIDLSDCPDFESNPDFQGTLHLWPTVPNDKTSPTSAVGISIGPSSSPTALSSFVKVVPAVTSSPFALIQPQVRQRHAPTGAYSSGFDNQYLSVGECLNPAYSQTDSKEGLQKVQNTYDGVSLNLADNSCHSGYIELKFDVTSQVSAQKSSLNLEITPKVADGLFISKIIATRKSTGFATVPPKDYPFGTKSVSLDKPAFLDNLASGESLSFTALLLPRTAMRGGFTYKFTFDNGQAATTVAPGEVKYVDAVVYSPEVKVGQVRPIFCNGNAALFFKADSNPQGGPLPRSGCNDISMIVDSIFPADAIPIELESSYLTACSQSLDAKLYAFLPPLDATVPDLSRSLSIEKVAGQYVVKFDATAGNYGGPYVRGNTFFKNGKPMPPGDGVLGGARLRMLCRIENKEDAKVDITILKQEINGVNAIDGSYIAFKGQAHELAYTLYNGQFPMSLSVAGNAEGDGLGNTRQYSFDPDNDPKANKRLNYWLVRNSKLPESAQTYPINFYPDGGAAKVSDGITITGPDNVEAYRPGSWLQRIVALAHQDKDTSDLQGAFLSDPTKVCNAINYVANGVMKQVPITFANVGLGIARTSAFRRSPAVLGQWWCAPRADTHEYSCYPNVNNWINTSIVQTFGAPTACTGCTDISEDAPPGGSFDLKLLDSKGVEIKPTSFPLSDGSSKSFLQLPEAATSFTFSSGVDAKSVSLEFKRSGSSVCPTKASSLAWCSGSAGDGEKFLNKYDSSALSLQKSGSDWSAFFDADSNGASDGSWMVRLKATDADGLSTVSKAVILAVTLKSRACHSAGANGKQCSLNWCDPQCGSDGTKKEVISAGPLTPDNAGYWLNESELKLDFLVPCGAGQTSGCVAGIGKYSGAPFKYFIPDRPFTLSLPLIAWGWQVPNLQAQYKPENELCSVGMGAYELKLSSKAGDVVEYTIALSRLPTKNYLLDGETTDTWNSKGTHSGKYRDQGYNVENGERGCSIKTERKYPDGWGDGSDWIVTGAQTQFSTKQWPKAEDNKWLCNVVPVHVDLHHRDGGGLMDCLKYCSKEYCGNCGTGNVFCPIPTSPQVNKCDSNIPTPPVPPGYSGPYCASTCEAPFDESIRVND
ncbi:hypothetical protein HY095_04545 [Candidatus Micrarchaeota archaeon]|nr:hypothetical protein [Candidatus Micrarchaeota archaeon]